jgi:hypothetical protein
VRFDVSRSRKLFKKLWKELLKAAALEALAESSQPSQGASSNIQAVSEWLGRFDDSQPEEESFSARTRITHRRDEIQYHFESYDVAASSTTVHECLIAAVQ